MDEDRKARLQEKLQTTMDELEKRRQERDDKVEALTAEKLQLESEKESLAAQRKALEEDFGEQRRAIEQQLEEVDEERKQLEAERATRRMSSRGPAVILTDDKIAEMQQLEENEVF